MRISLLVSNRKEVFWQVRLIDLMASMVDAARDAEATGALRSPCPQQACASRAHVRILLLSSVPHPTYPLSVPEPAAYGAQPDPGSRAVTRWSRARAGGTEGR